MQTSFSDAQRQNPDVAAAETILRKCVHCGFCTATCPTYVLLGDELDSPRGRIYLIKDMLENERPATREVVRHIDRCLSCLSCMTTCPSGVDYRRLIDRARVHVETTYRRPVLARLQRALVARLFPYPGRFKAALLLGRLIRPFRRFAPQSLRPMLELLPVTGPPAPQDAGRGSAAPVNSTAGPRVAVLTGCVQAVVGQAITAASIRLLERAGARVQTVDGCCGSIVHHIGDASRSVELARPLLLRLHALVESEGLDAIVSDASGCGSQLKDIAHQFRDDPELFAIATRLQSLVRDVSETLIELGLPESIFDAQHDRVRVAYHSACSMQHGQRLIDPPRRLLASAGFEVVEIGEGHLCCGSAGTYNLFQPGLARQLGARKLEHITATGASVVAGGNLGCLTQLAAVQQRGAAGADPLVFVHTVELLDWATGGPKPAAFAGKP